MASRALGWGLVVYVACACLVLGTRQFLLPRVDSYRPQIERLLGEALERQVRIDALSADWTGLHPHLALRGLTLLDATDQPALRLEQVDAALGFSSLVRGRLHLHRLDINGNRKLWMMLPLPMIKIPLLRRVLSCCASSKW